MPTDPTDAPRLDVKVAKAVPSGASAVAVPAFSDRLSKVAGVRKPALDRAGFRGAPGSTLVLDDGSSVRVVVGLGPSKSVGATELRKAGAAFARAASRHRRIAFEVPENGLDVSAATRAVTEGLILGAYTFTEFKKPDDSRPTTASATIAVGDADLRAGRAGAAEGTVVADAVCFARDLVNTPGGSLTPTVFADRAAERALAAGLTAEVLDMDDIRAAGLGGVIAVNQGSAEPARVVKLTYEPDDADNGDTIALVGKGITFDSGGLSIKPAEGMMTMKCDMAGAAAVIAAMCALPAVGARTRVVSFTPMTDNMTGGFAQRPGDIYTAHNGTTVEVLNTDAEGRLILADALSLASDEDPAAIVDLATLTGACMVALGDRIAGLMSNDDAFRDVVAAASESAGERVWPLPLPDDYRPRLDSPVADIKNIGGGRFGGALTAGLFLRDFVGEGIPWAHLDIAGPAYLEEPADESPKGGTGFGVRTLIALIEGWSDGADSFGNGSDSEDAGATGD